MTGFDKRLQDAALSFLIDHGPILAAKEGHEAAKAVVAKRLQDALEAQGIKLVPATPKAEPTFWIVRSAGGRFFEAGNEYEYELGRDPDLAHKFNNRDHAESWLKNLKRDYPFEDWHIPSSK